MSRCTAPATIPTKIADIQDAGVFNVPAGNLVGLAKTCAEPPPTSSSGALPAGRLPVT